MDLYRQTTNDLLRSKQNELLSYRPCVEFINIYLSSKDSCCLIEC